MSSAAAERRFETVPMIVLPVMVFLIANHNLSEAGANQGRAGPTFGRPQSSYFVGEYAVVVKNTRSGGLARILPSASLSSRTLIHSGSAWNSFQFLSAASRLSCEMT